MINRRHLGLAGLALGAGAAGLAWQMRQDSGSSAAQDPLWDMAFEQPDGAKLALSSFRGKPLLVNFWATWCPPCVEELPLIERFYQQNKVNGWQVLALAVDNLVPVQRFLRTMPLGFSVGMAGLAGTELSRSLGNVSGGLPYTVVFAADGRVAKRHIGKLQAADLATFATLAKSG